MKYRKMPVVIDAFHYTGNNARALITWATEFGTLIKWQSADGCVIIPTLEGDMKASPGDWIIRGVQGEFYPCKPDIFKHIYELVT